MNRKPRACQRAACVQCRHDLGHLRELQFCWDQQRDTPLATIERIAFDHAAHNAARIAQAQIVKLERRIERLKKP